MKPFLLIICFFASQLLFAHAISVKGWAYVEIVGSCFGVGCFGGLVPMIAESSDSVYLRANSR